MNIPKDLSYTREHEWAEIKGESATIGITDYAVEQLGDITLVELPEKGIQVKAGDAVGVIESVKAVSDLYSPVSGEVAEVNQTLEDAPEQVNDDPYKGGWMFVVTLSDPAEKESLLDAAAYEAFVDTLED